MKMNSSKLAGLADFLEEQDIVSLIRLNLVLFVGVALVGITGFAIVRDAGWAHFARNALFLIVGSLLVIYLLYKGRISLAAYSSLLIYGLILTYSAWTGAGVKGTVYTLFFLLVVGAALLIGRRGGYVTAVIAALLGLFLLLAGREGLLVNLDRPSVDFVTWITLSVSFLIAAHIVGLVIRQAERALERARRDVGAGAHRFRRVFEVSPVAIVLTTLDEGRTIDANEAYWNLSGHDPKTAIGKTTFELRRGYDKARRQEFVDSLVEKRSLQIPDYTFVDDWGRTRHTVAFFELIELDGTSTILSMFYDMTEQVEARVALQRSEQRVRGLLAAVPETILELSREGTILQYVASDEASAHDLSGEVVGKSIDQVVPASVAGQIRFAVERALESGQLHIIEYALPQDGREIDFETRVTVSGKDTVLLMARDVSLHKNFESERERMIEELDDKNSELERFTKAVSHDLKSPLITIRGFLGFVKEDVASGNAGRLQSDIQRMNDAMDTMQGRLDDLLELSHAGRLISEPRQIHFNELVQEALELVHGRISQRGIATRVEAHMPAVVGDRQRLLEVLQNLLDNAAKFMGDQPAPLIEIGQCPEQEGKPVFFVRDNGMGIPPEQHGRIFGVFNKLNPKAEGTGIGLSLVKKIIETHRGRIWVESEIGKGSTFYFTLPRG